MPARIGSVELPDRSPNFLLCRRAVRPFLIREKSISIGLSGGADSLALVAASRAEGAEVHAICVDHGLQSGSRAVAETAAEQAVALGCTAEVVGVEVAPGNVEANARKARYAVLEQSHQPVWVAHTMDDQAETYLLGALRGNPAGMLPISQLGETVLVRPFLSVRRANTAGACVELALQPWQDPHNSELAFRRVALRHDFLPQLSTLAGTDAVVPMAQAAQRAALAADYIASQRVDINVDALKQAHPAVRQASIGAWLIDKVGKITWPVVHEVERLVTDWHGQGPIAVGGDEHTRVSVRRRGKFLVLERTERDVGRR
ncbi:tRNA lysidine(34) synthetase TilS [Staphylococcus chromogenes]|nr:tRNA lysidine(34) synthetase TilS [Staphylococcus chromogenes]